MTVGTSRKEQPIQGIIFNLLRELDFSMKALVAKNVLNITRIQPAIAFINGYTLYDINNLDMEGNPVDTSTITIKKRGGVSLAMKSRAEASKILMGTKRTIVSTGHVYVGQGKSDGAPLVILPLLGEKGYVRSLLLIHVKYNDALSVKGKKDVLGYRYNDIRNTVNEYNIPWDDACLEDIPIETLLEEAVEIIAGKIKNTFQQRS